MANVDFKVDFITDDNGMIIDYKIVEDEMMQSAGMDDALDFLEHFGVKGMQWGVRNGGGAATKGGGGGNTRYRTSAKHLSDAELAARIKRLETEKRYRDLNAKHVGAGRKHINEVLTRVGKESAVKIGTNAAMYAARKAIAKKFGQNMATTMTR